MTGPKLLAHAPRSPQMLPMFLLMRRTAARRDSKRPISCRDLFRPAYVHAVKGVTPQASPRPSEAPATNSRAAPR